jgi:hypothetical protein
MKTITINYLSHNRLSYTDLIFYFLKNIKSENKNKLHLNILATHENDWKTKCDELGIDYTVHLLSGHLNYMSKIKIAVSSDTEYSVKLDEDCFMNNHLWDYLIENVSILERDDVLSISPTMSNNIPSCDYFIEDFITDPKIKTDVHNFFLKREMPNGLWGVDYSSLNKHTIHSNKWDFKNYYSDLEKLNTYTKGIHPLRISYESQMIINDYIGNNIEKFLSKNDYNFFEIYSPYFTNSLFFIKTKNWLDIVNQPSFDSFDEITFNKYKKDKNKIMLFVKNGFGIHPMFNTVHGNKNIWGIGGENGEQDEIDFYNKIKNLIIS